MSSNRICPSIDSLYFHSLAIIFLLHRIVNIESFPQITRSDPVNDFNQDRLPHFSHSDQPLSHITWVWIDDLILMNLDRIGPGHAILMYVDVDKSRCSFLYSDELCTVSHDQCVLSKTQVNMVDWDVIEEGKGGRLG